MINIENTNKQWIEDFKKKILEISIKAEKEILFNGENSINTITRQKTKIINSVKINNYLNIEIEFSDNVVNDVGQDRLRVLAVGGIIMTKGQSNNQPVTIKGSTSLKKLLIIAKVLGEI